MKLAQLEIKATVTVNTSDLGNRKREDDSQDKDVPVRKKGQRSLTIVSEKMRRPAATYDLHGFGFVCEPAAGRGFVWFWTVSLIHLCFLYLL